MSDKSDTQPSLAKVDQDKAVATSRRTFLQRLAVGGGLALGVGGLAAYFVNQERTTVIVLPNGDAVSVPAGTDVDETLDLINQLAALKEALAESDQERRTLSEQLAAAQAEIEQLQEDRDGLLSLVGLYEALEETGLDDILSTGFVAVGAGMATARGLIGLLETGVTKGLSALEDFVESIPGPQAGLIWLKGELSALLINLQNLTERIEDVIEPIESFATLVAEFILDVLRKLPFGLGNPARGGLETMQTIITGLPGMTDGIAADVLDPLEVWFGQDNKTNLVGTLVSPLETDLITPATSAVETFNTLDASYQDELKKPAQTALDTRASIRAQIEQQRAQLNGVLLARSDRAAS